MSKIPSWCRPRVPRTRAPKKTKFWYFRNGQPVPETYSIRVSTDPDRATATAPSGGRRRVYTHHGLKAIRSDDENSGQ